MISPETFVLLAVGYFGFLGVANIILAICQSEKSIRSHYGFVEGVGGLIFLGVAVAMVVL